MILTNEELADDIDSGVFPYSQGGPLMHQIAAKAVSFREAQRPGFEDYAKQIKKNAQTLADTLQDNGLSLVSGGTDNHLVLVDLRDEDITGKKGETALEQVNIITNKNMVPYDPESPKVTSGVRIGTPALTTRGMEEEEFEEIGNMIAERLHNPDDRKVRERISERVKELLEEFPLYAETDLDY